MVHSYPTGLNNVQFEIAIILRMPLFDEELHRWKEWQSALETTSLEMDLGERGRYTPKLRVVRVEEVPARLIRAMPVPLPLTARYALVSDVEIHCLPEVQFEPPPAAADADLPATLERSLAADGIQQWVEDLVIASNLAIPGSMPVSCGVIASAHSLDAVVFGRVVDHVGQAADAARQIGWPTVRTLSLRDTWLWLHARRLPTTPPQTQRALNAFERVLQEGSSPVSLLWSMVGIEALYVSGSTALLEQVRERSRLLLGDSERAKKVVSRMYDLRSRFVHGDLDFGGSFDVKSNPDAESDELDWASDVAVALLLATLQELIQRGWPGLRFTTACESA